MRPEESFEIQRENMVEDQLKRGGIKDPEILFAFSSIPRELFVPKEHRTHSYRNGPVSIGHGQTISQPLVVAKMCEYLDLKGDEIILEVGGGSGYAAAVLSYLCEEVVTVEYFKPLAAEAARRFKELELDNIKLIVGDGTRDAEHLGPYNRIILSCAANYEVPEALFEQLDKEDDFILAPIKNPPVNWGREALFKIDKRKEYQYLSDVHFVPLIEG